jgi:hypothetical protein
VNGVFVRPVGIPHRAVQVTVWVELDTCRVHPVGPPAPNGLVHSGLLAWHTGTQVGEKLYVAGGRPNPTNRTAAASARATVTMSPPGMAPSRRLSDMLVPW